MNSFERKPSCDEIVQLSAGRLRLEISPGVGGAISAFEWTDANGSRPIMRKSNSPLNTALDACSFPLVPYVNRIRGGCFVFEGRTVRLAPNMAGDPSPLHGQGWLNPWSVESMDEHRALLHFRHEAGEWPWTYEARHEFVLDDRGLSLTLTCRNLAGDAMPCGLGEHPYFPCGPRTMIDTMVTEAWTIDEQVLPVAKVPAEGRYSLENRSACAQDLDNGFGGWSGTALMTDPSWPFKLRLSSSDAHFFQLYSPMHGGIFVAEPVTHANAALNAPEDQWPELGIRILQPGDETSLTTRLDVIAV